MLATDSIRTRVCYNIGYGYEIKILFNFNYCFFLNILFNLQKLAERDKRKENLLQKKTKQEEEKLLKAILEKDIKLYGSGRHTFFNLLL